MTCAVTQGPCWVPHSVVTVLTFFTLLEESPKSPNPHQLHSCPAAWEGGSGPDSGDASDQAEGKSQPQPLRCKHHHLGLLIQPSHDIEAAQNKDRRCSHTTGH